MITIDVSAVNVALAIALAAAGAFVWLESRAAVPAVPLGLFRGRAALVVLASGPSTAGSPQGTASPGQSLTLICCDPTGQSIGGYATWDQLSSGLWVYDGLMNTPPGGPTGLPKCANYPPDR